MTKILIGDCIESLCKLEPESVNTCITSPPYFGLRDYGVDGQFGLEETPEEYVSKLVDVFREVHRVLRPDGTIWLNIGDRYAVSKQLLGIPWRVAFALQADGWILRQDIIWNKPSQMPESTRDRCTKSHEYIFLLAKRERYYYDQEAIRVPLKDPNAARLIQKAIDQRKGCETTRKGSTPKKAVCKTGKGYDPTQAGGGSGVSGHSGYFDRDGKPLCGVTANKKSVWTVCPSNFKGPHFATFPPELIRPCVLAGCPKGGTVLDPFAGSGTTGAVAIEEGRRAVLCELNPKYGDLINARLSNVQPKLL